jgi:Mlc titration factor MtfA (ptsG expression regulator)
VTYVLIILFCVGGIWLFLKKKSRINPINEREKAALIKNFDFYKRLPPKSKEIFEVRTAYFREIKTFVPRSMPEVTEEMKLLISACAVKLTFGYPKIFLSYFKYIVVFPDQYFNSAAQRYHKGEVNPKDRAIVLSWRHFVHGYAFNDGVNLGLHEMAHALRLENVVENKEFDFINPKTLKAWQTLAQEEIKAVREGTDIFFRSYAGTNYEEFFAVAVESFFERPREFRNRKPELYESLSNLLNQDPMNLR